jgi:hypothetical protein
MHTVTPFRPAAAVRPTDVRTARLAPADRVGCITAQDLSRGAPGIRVRIRVFGGSWRSPRFQGHTKGQREQEVTPGSHNSVAMRQAVRNTDNGRLSGVTRTAVTAAPALRAVTLRSLLGSIDWWRYQTTSNKPYWTATAQPVHQHLGQNLSVGSAAHRAGGGRGGAGAGQRVSSQDAQQLGWNVR